MDWDGNRIDKLGKMIYIWSQFSTKVLQIIILDIKIRQKGKKKNFSRELQKDKSIQTLSPAIYLEGWGKHFEHEYTNRPSKNLIES